MRAARAANDIPGVMKHFGELCEHYPDSQGPGAFEILLSIAAHEGNPEAAMETLEAMLAVGYPPTHHTHRKIIIAHNRGGQLTQAWEWLQMLAQSEGDEYLAHAEGNTGATLFNAVLTGASKKADVVVFHECWTAMKHARVDPDEGTLEAFMLMESKIGDSERRGRGVGARGGVQIPPPDIEPIAAAILSQSGSAREDSDVLAQAAGRVTRGTGPVEASHGW